MTKKTKKSDGYTIIVRDKAGQEVVKLEDVDSYLCVWEGNKKMDVQHACNLQWAAHAVNVAHCHILERLMGIGAISEQLVGLGRMAVGNQQVLQQIVATLQKQGIMVTPEDAKKIILANELPNLPEDGKAPGGLLKL